MMIDYEYKSCKLTLLHDNILYASDSLTVTRLRFVKNHKLTTRNVPSFTYDFSNLGFS